MTAPNVYLSVAGTDVSCYALANVRCTVGRETVYEQSEASTLNCVLVLDQVGGAAGTVVIGAPVELWVSSTPRTAATWADAAALWADPAVTWGGAGWEAPDWRLFLGTVTDIRAELASDGRWVQNLTAAGSLAELARTPIGDEPWPSESDSQRMARVLSLAGYDTTGVPDVAGPMLLPRDVDRQPALRLMQEIAASGGGWLGEDPHTGAVVYRAAVLRDITNENPWDQYAGAWDDAPGAWDDALGAPSQPWVIDPCTVLLDPWLFTATVGDLVTWCEVKYGDPEAVVESGSRTPPVHGRTITTDLVSSADAQALADRTIWTRSVPRWNAPSAVMRVNRLPAGEWRYLPELIVGGRAVTLEPMPPGSPYPSLTGFLEGWTHRIGTSGDELDWTVELHISDAPLSAPFTTWDTADPLLWDTLDPGNVWDQPRLTGAAIYEGAPSA